jgi:hypothetical protein
VLKFYFVKHYFSPLKTFMRKGKDPELDLDPHLLLMDSDPGGPKTYGSCGSGSPTLVSSLKNLKVKTIKCNCFIYLPFPVLILS